MDDLPNSWAEVSFDAVEQRIQHVAEVIKGWRRMGWERPIFFVKGRPCFFWCLAVESPKFWMRHHKSKIGLRTDWVGTSYEFWSSCWTVPKTSRVDQVGEVSSCFSSQQLIFFCWTCYTTEKLTWHWKITMLNRKYIFKWCILHCYVRFFWGVHIWSNIIVFWHVDCLNEILNLGFAFGDEQRCRGWSFSIYCSIWVFPKIRVPQNGWWK